LTVLRRVSYTRAVISGRNPPTDPRTGPLSLKLRPWRWPRMSLPYDLVTAANIAWLLLAPVGNIDPLRAVLAGWGG
ncbi:MAG: hypothetical protein J7M21_01425, partial [Planctomycetes bacterium]|nr:hypothetical protein [Planctomycetota bacterium]